MFKVEVLADNSGKFVSNELMFSTIPAAQRYAKDLASRWTLVRETRVREATAEEAARDYLETRFDGGA